MTAYLIRRLLLVVPTLLAILFINFVLIQIAPGGPIAEIIAQIGGIGADTTARIGAGGGFEERGVGGTGGNAQAGVSLSSSGEQGFYRGATGLTEEHVARLRQEFGFDKPLLVRFTDMLGRYLVFDFGKSYFRDRSVIDLVIDKMPVSISLGAWSLLLTYAIGIPLGVAKAVRDGSRFDVFTTSLVVVGYSVPGFLFAVLLLVLFAGGRFFNFFPLGGLVSESWEQLEWWEKILDYLWHLTLPVAALVIGSFAGLTMLVKNSFLDQIRRQYVVVARAKGATPTHVLYGHVFRNAMLIVIAGIPAALIGVLFTGSLLIEIIFSLDGLGLLGFEAVIKRDYPLMFGTLYIFTLLGLILGILSDFLYTVIDPRIDFESL